MVAGSQKVIEKKEVSSKTLESAVEVTLEFTNNSGYKTFLDANIRW